MDTAGVDRLVKQLSAGFEALQDEYQKLHGQHQALERKLTTAREQYNELAKLYGSGQTSTPPLSLSSSPGQAKEDSFAPSSVLEILDRNVDSNAKAAANKVKIAIAASNYLKQGLPLLPDASSAHGVKIWSGPSADRTEGSSSVMPSIQESPLEQDFTVEGKPSKLGCPFASMANKKLSSHAASVLSRYNQSGSVGAHGSVAASSTPLSTTSRVNGRESFSQRQSRKGSFMDPIKAEMCGLSDHDAPDMLPPPSEQLNSPTKETEKPENAEVGVCPIRFLDQHSPEEVATYFENHKHELPRSHEFCVMRYQSNEEQIKELDAKYGNLVSMIQGLGQKHKDMLPEDPDDAVDDHDELGDAKVRKWASSVSAQAPETGDEEQPEDRLQYFERPLREVRVGESPSRPWGERIPEKYLEKAQGGESDRSSIPAHVAQPAAPDMPPSKNVDVAPQPPTQTQRPAGKCPFGHSAAAPAAETSKPVIVEPPAPISEPAAKPETRPNDAKEKELASPRMVFTGPVFIGYSPEDAAKMLSGLRMNQ